MYPVRIVCLVITLSSHSFEKMISGRYLGEMVRLVLVQLQDDGLFLVGNASDKLRTPQVFESSYLSDIETG